MINHLGFQILLEAVRGFLLFQSSKPKNVSLQPYVCDHSYGGQLGQSPFTMIPATNESTGLDLERNAFWLRGSEDDFYTMQQLKQAACEDATIPVIVFSMQPVKGLLLEIEAVHYMPDERIRTWKEYDEKIDYYAERLADIPSIIVMEPSLLMYTFNSINGYHNSEYQLAFAERVEKVIGKFQKSWVYVDAGNVMYLQHIVNLEHMKSVLKKMPAQLRGFSINVGYFANTTFNRQLAEEIYCETGLHYIVDTSRNGGEFSTRSIEEINRCKYDPPMIETGDAPSWQSGSSLKQTETQSLYGGVSTSNTQHYHLGGTFSYEGKRRRKRWSFPGNEDGSGGQYEIYSPQVGGSDSSDGLQDFTEATRAYREGTDSEIDGFGSDFYDYDLDLLCVATPGQGLDAFAWIKTPGESDGRMFPAGTYHSCLLGHSTECSDDTCPEYVSKLRGEFKRRDSCECRDQ